ncbi:MAG: hypothetical protein IBJ13_05245 [Sphingopyxis sp.]|nr:hypothetical protein [Sphingopyxis sp.]
MILWLGAFINDGRDALARSSLSEGNKDIAVELFNKLSSPFRYPFGLTKFFDFKNSQLEAEKLSHLSLIDEWVSKEVPIFIPEQAEISEIVDKLKAIDAEFSELDIPQFIRTDFSNHLKLYITVATKMPMVAHQLISNESTKLISWLLSSLSPEAKKTVSKAAIAINALVAVFIAPVEASNAAHTYYEWMLEVEPTVAAIEGVVAPPALPAPKPD